MSDRNERDEAGHGDEALAALIEEKTRWGPRSAMERRAFDARLTDRLRRRPAWRRPVLALPAAAAAMAVLAWVLAVEPPAPQGEAGRGFLSAAYYAGGEGGEGVSDSYLPADYQIWADALDATEEPPGGAS